MTVRFRYCSYLKFDLDDGRDCTWHRELAIPNSVGGRYGTPPPEWHGAVRSAVPERGTTYQVYIYDEKAKCEPLWGQFSGSTIEWITPYGSRGLYGNYTSEVPFTGVFVLDISAPYKMNATEAVLKVILLQNRGSPTEYAMMITLPPGLLLGPLTDTSESDIIFLADRSGSMEDKITPLRSAMSVFLRQIPRKRRFNLWCFGSKCQSYWQNAVLYDRDTFGAAKTWTAQLEADMGGTELLSALQRIKSSIVAGRPTSVIVLTDGLVYSVAAVMDFVSQTFQESQGQIRFFSVGLGQDVSHELVEGIGRSGGGVSEIVTEAHRGGWEEKLSEMLVFCDDQPCPRDAALPRWEAA
jgi:hypothetical protein